MFVVALDPGGITGWAVWASPHGVVGGGQISGEDHRLQLIRFLTGMFCERSEGTVVCEQFEQRGMDTKVDQRALIYIATVQAFCEDAGIEFVLRRPSDVKSFWTDQKLRRLGLYVPGKPHQNDAERHLLSYICLKDSVLRREILVRLRPTEGNHEDGNPDARAGKPRPAKD